MEATTRYLAFPVSPQGPTSGGVERQMAIADPTHHLRTNRHRCCPSLLLSQRCRWLRLHHVLLQKKKNLDELPSSWGWVEDSPLQRNPVRQSTNCWKMNEVDSIVDLAFHCFPLEVVRIQVTFGSLRTVLG